MKIKWNIPWLSALATLILTMIILVNNYLVDLPVIAYILNGRLLIPKYLFLVILSVTIVLFGYIIISRLKGNKAKKHIQYPAKLDTLEFEGIIFTFEIRFNFDPKLLYDPSDFSDNISISEHYVCADLECKSALINRHAGNSMTYISCPNDRRHVDMDKDNEFFVLSQRAEGFFKGMVMRDFDKYWKIYKKELKRATGGRLRDFYPPWDLNS